MKKYKVTLHLMVDPTKGDETVKRHYRVEAENEFDAFSKAQEKQTEDEEEFRYLSTFKFDAKEKK